MITINGVIKNYMNEPEVIEYVDSKLYKEISDKIEYSDPITEVKSWGYYKRINSYDDSKAMSYINSNDIKFYVDEQYFYVRTVPENTHIEFIYVKWVSSTAPERSDKHDFGNGYAYNWMEFDNNTFKLLRKDNKSTNMFDAYEILDDSGKPYTILNSSTGEFVSVRF